MNDLRSSMNVRTLDDTMRTHYQGESLTDGEVDEITDVWKRCGNRRIELQKETKHKRYKNMFT